MDISFQYMKKRSDFGHQPLLCEQGPDMCDSIATNPTEHKHFILRNPVHELIQNTPNFSQNEVNTRRAKYATTGVQHSEGGWPKDVNNNDPEATQRYRRKVEKEDGYIHCVMNQTPGLEHYVLQNNAIDMYRAYFAEMLHGPMIEHNSIRTINVFRDPEMRPASAINWQPKGHRFCVCYVDVDYYRLPRKPTYANIWNLGNANSAELYLQPPAPMLDLKYSPREPELLIGGLTTGQVVEFDSRAGPEQTNSCPLHVAHRDLVRQVMFINSKSGKEYFSSGPDGVVKWWDSRNLSEPTDEMIIDMVSSANDVPSMATAFGVSVLEYESTIPTRFMVGTENGYVIGGNRKGKTPTEQLPAKFEAHNGPIVSLERNPAFPKNFLTVGDWRAKIWTEECRESAVLWTPPQRHKIYSGTWSPTRMSLMLLCGGDGRLHIWDILRRLHEPIVSVQLCREPLVTQCFHEQGHYVAVGNKSGDVILEELSDSLISSDPNDKSLLLSVFERVSKLEHTLEARLREVRLKMRQAEEASPTGSVAGDDPTTGDKDLNEATTDFWQIVKKEQAALI